MTSGKNNIIQMYLVVNRAFGLKVFDALIKSWLLFPFTSASNLSSDTFVQEVFLGDAEVGFINWFSL